MNGKIIQSIVFTYLTQHDAQNPEILVAMLIDECYEDMVYVAMRYTNNYHIAEEVVSDVMFKICKKDKKWIYDTVLKLNSNFAGMLHTMLRCASINAWKKSSKSIRTENIDDQYESSLPFSSTNIDFIDFDFNEYLAKLNDKERFVVQAYHVDGFDHQEISDKHPDIRSASESRVILCRANKKLRVLLVNYK